MNIKTTKISTALILAMGLSMPFFASAEDKKEAMPVEGAEVVECITQADIDVMTDADKAKLTARVCNEEEAAEKAAAEEAAKAAQ
jgi:hypothetical protein